jgi:hypothetical protein
VGHFFLVILTVLINLFLVHPRISKHLLLSCFFIVLIFPGEWLRFHIWTLDDVHAPTSMLERIRLFEGLCCDYTGVLLKQCRMWYTLPFPREALGCYLDGQDSTRTRNTAAEASGDRCYCNSHEPSDPQLLKVRWLLVNCGRALDGSWCLGKFPPVRVRGYSGKCSMPLQKLCEGCFEELRSTACAWNATKRSGPSRGRVG